MHNDEPAPKKEDEDVDDDVEINMDEANIEQDTIEEDDDDEEDFDDAGEVKLIPVGVHFIITDLFHFSLPIVEQAAGRPQLRAGQARAEERLDPQRAQGDPQVESRGQAGKWPN